MNVHFGTWNFDGRPVSSQSIEQVRALLGPYGTEGCEEYDTGNCWIHFHSRISPRQPKRCTARSGIVFTWDGRLDNRGELMSQLHIEASIKPNDIEIVAEAYDRWGAECLAKLLGDWVLSVWDPVRRSLTLAKDIIGTRQLYYCVESGRVTWGTTLDPLLQLAERSLQLDEEYIAGWYSLFPASHLTPYKGVHSVPPASSVLITPSQATVRTYWTFDPQRRTHYRTDRDYEEHFFALFSESVRRRLDPGVPVLAELSGGMDSSSIVCVADALIAEGRAGKCRLDTVSYVDDTEPGWNERPYFTIVEHKRGRPGYHLDLSSQDGAFDYADDRCMTTPACGAHSPAMRDFQAWLNGQGYRVLLSGIGGDEILGGIPTPTPELADLLTRGHLQMLTRQLIAWALAKRKPVVQLLWESLRVFLPPARNYKDQLPASWLCSGFVKRNWVALQGYSVRIKLVGPLPSFQDNLATLDALRRQLACSAISSDSPYEKRYPYLDRDLLEFLFSIPPGQLVRPGQRRSLMRRALVGIVPAEILGRRRKAYVVRSPLRAISTMWPKMMGANQQMVSSRLGIVDLNLLRTAVEKALQGQEVPLIPLMRTLGVEMWLRHLARCGLLNPLPMTDKTTLQQQLAHRSEMDTGIFSQLRTTPR